MRAPDNNKLEKLTREVRDINGAMNDLSSSTMEDIRNIKEEISEVSSVTTERCRGFINAINEMAGEIEKDIN